jgi:1-acyl-sn-glycerol-3-phosphate acyltransferase/acyl carrier protein
VRRHLLPPPSEQPKGTGGAPPVEGDPLAEAVGSVAHVTSVADGQTLGQLGLDSLGLTELLAQIEDRTGRAVPESALSTDMTIADLRTAVAAAPLVEERTTADLQTAQSLPIPRWFYTTGWRLRPALAAPFDLLYRLAIPRTLVLGGEYLRNLPSGTVFAGNHRSFADMPLVRVGLQKTPARRFARRLVIAAMAEGAGWRSPMARYVAAAFGLYPLDRLGQRESSLRRLASLARGGNAVLIFPGGTHARRADERGDPPAVRFKTGVAHVAEALGAPVVPFGLAGTEEAMPPFVDDFRGLVIGGVPVALKRRTLAIAFGPPQEQADDESPQQFAERLEGLCYALAAKADAARGAPGG